MRKALLGMTVALALAATPVLAQQGLYGSVQVGIADYTFADSNGIAGVGTLGVRLPQLGANVAFEGEVTRTLERPEISGMGISSTTAGGYGVHALPMGPRLALRTRVGLAYQRVEFPGATETDISGSAGIGLAFQLQNGLRLVADHTLIGTDITTTSVGVQVKF